MQHIKLKHKDPTSWQTGTLMNTALPAVTRNYLSEEWSKLSDKIMSLYQNYRVSSRNTVILIKPKTRTAYCGHITHFCSQVAYTFDAGPNACLYLLECEVPKLLSVICHIFPPENEGVEYLQGIPVEKRAVSQVNINTVSIYFRLHKTHSISVTE